jgi:hypothetical protein
MYKIYIPSDRTHQLTIRSVCSPENESKTISIITKTKDMCEITEFIRNLINVGLESELKQAVIFHELSKRTTHVFTVKDVQNQKIKSFCFSASHVTSADLIKYIEGKLQRLI